ncbi:APC family permease [Vulcanisaeta sp. JCM 14467]|uniref:APC family permease n=1 Tax=Vulcanisaeta sp. JCM 14467 TaxID=1295370 RepID=UPI000AB9F3C4|nr:APC family permease [Vulcanisaeta sp. JCM 14467]
MTTKENNSETPRLKPVLNMWETLAGALGANGPAAVTALYFTSLAGLVGGSMMLDILLAWLIYVAMTVVVYDWSKDVAAAHSWTVIQRKGFNSALAAYFAGWTYWAYYLTGSVGFAVLGLSSFVYLLIPKAPSWLWIPIALAIIAETSILAYLGIKPSNKYILYTGLYMEVPFLIVTALILIIMAGPKNSVLPFTVKPVNNNWILILTTMIFGITTFGGMNQVIPLAEETVDPKRNVPRALAAIAIILGVTIMLNGYAQEVIYGINKMAQYSQLPDPGVIIYGKYLGVVGAALLIAFVVNSFNSSALAFFNSEVRMAFGLARDGVIFPRRFVNLNKYGAPGDAIIFLAILNAVVAIAAGIALGPLWGGVWLLTFNSVFMALNHLLAAIGIARYRHKYGGFGIIRHIVIPAIVVGALATFIVLSVYPAPPPPITYAPYAAFIWIILGIVAYYIEKRKRPEAIAKLGLFSV